MRREDVERMEPTRPHVKLGLPAGIPQGVRIGHGFVAKYLGATDVEKRGW